ncbi:helix-turn-helix domain-containing protein [Marinobacter daepoensis]|uniref:Helix-turn-helix transcriptional regulator n=1 Tax=Marinobacter daepoensis TaxID=262077 RepID=A0ABS3BFN1_9GAMM|nr:helix-turn-helix transcriptional regulator [Marinobacter daepoensis]MBN7770474.1 helix-turn-helix transcriptional regulator [Marinobacter daepoensis]MBY6079920.1 helix-turn-helix domain-containing protein [Marinobacter daepoensis]
MQHDTQSDAALAIGQRLAEIRNGKSQGAFAEELGIHKNSLGHYERGNRVPDAAVLLKLLEMGFSANWVLTGEGSKDAKGSKEGLTQDIEKLRKLDEEFALIPGYNVQVAAGHGSLAGTNHQPENWRLGERGSGIGDFTSKTWRWLLPKVIRWNLQFLTTKS